MKLAEKLLEVSKSIKYLEKDKSNKMQGYKYLSEAKIKEVIKSAFEKERILFNYSTEAVREYEISPTKNGAKQFVTIASGKYSFIDCDSEEILNGTWFGSGSDTSDKGLYKAITGGIKYVLNTDFLIPTGDDPENDENDKDKDKGKPPVTPPKPPVKPVVKIETEVQLKNRLVAEHNGDKEAAKKEYEDLMVEKLQGKFNQEGMEV